MRCKEHQLANLIAFAARSKGTRLHASRGGPCSNAEIAWMKAESRQHTKYPLNLISNNLFHAYQIPHEFGRHAKANRKHSLWFEILTRFHLQRSLNRKLVA